jgi:uncharacterized membrane protein
MVLELKTPTGPELIDLLKVLPVFLCYALSFIYLGIYWNNHHHMLHLCTQVTGGVLWANLNLLFWLSLIPFTTGWLGENHFAKTPSAVYGIILFLSAISYWILQTTIIRAQKDSSILKMAIGGDVKGKISPLLYLCGIGISFVSEWAALSIYVFVALMWLVPDRRIERHFES